MTFGADDGALSTGTDGTRTASRSHPAGGRSRGDERQRQAEAEVQRIRQVEEAERQRLLAVDVSALARQRAQWQTELEKLQQTSTAERGLARDGLGRIVRGAGQAGSGATAAQCSHQGVYGLDKSAVSWFGLKRAGADIQQAKADLDLATKAVVAAQR